MNKRKSRLKRRLRRLILKSKLVFITGLILGMCSGVFLTYIALSYLTTDRTIPCKKWGGQIVVRVGKKWYLAQRAVELEVIEIIK